MTEVRRGDASRALLVGVATALAAALAAASCSSKASCPTGQTSCYGLCADLQTDPSNCGSCGARCVAGGSCLAGACSCPPGETACTACVNLNTDPGNCGSCRFSCGQGTCAAGACVCAGSPTPDPCPAGDAGTCVNKSRDPLNCGACGTRCPTNGVCDGGACGCEPPRPALCGDGGSCVDVRSDPKNCGACGAACALANATCQDGGCACAPPLPDPCLVADGGRCVDRASDPENCGACGHACDAGQGCADGGCAATCTGIVCRTTCCQQGTACCGSACETQHANGLGQSYFDCNPLGTFDPTTAAEAAAAWAPAGTNRLTPCGGSNCLDRTTTGSPSDCARWCYDGPFAGLVTHVTPISNVCLCPVPSSSYTTTWN